MGSRTSYKSSTYVLVWGKDKESVRNKFKLRYCIRGTAYCSSTFFILLRIYSWLMTFSLLLAFIMHHFFLYKLDAFDIFNPIFWQQGFTTPNFKLTEHINCICSFRFKWKVVEMFFMFEQVPPQSHFSFEVSSEDPFEIHNQFISSVWAPGLNELRSRSTIF